VAERAVADVLLTDTRSRARLALDGASPAADFLSMLQMRRRGTRQPHIGQIRGGKCKPNGHLDIAMMQSLVRKEKVDDLAAGYGHVIVDECHHLPAVSFERVLSEVKARYLVGLTATPQRRDGHTSSYYKEG
jgi:superfamily II DNA or RNA helicase